MTETLAHFTDWYGHLETRRQKAPLWADGTPVPWMTYPAICYLNQLDFSSLQVFEYGSGNSTLYWAKRARSVISVENDAAWFEQVVGKVPGNVELFHLSAPEYVDKVTHRSPHDIIVVDGRWRYDCCMRALDHLAYGGMIILDNAERHPPLTEHFRRHGLIEIDMIGPGPQNGYIWCTSIFLAREANFRPVRGFQPTNGPGMVDSIEVRPGHAHANKPGSSA